MDLQQKLQIAVDEYQKTVAEAQQLENQKNALINKYLKLEGRIVLLQEQLAENKEPTSNS